MVAEGAVATGAQSLHATIGATKPIVTGVAITPVNGASKTGVVLFGDCGRTVPLPVRELTPRTSSTRRRPQSSIRTRRGVAESGQVIAKGLKDAGIATKQVGYTQGQTDLTAPLLAAGAATADFIAPYGSASDCANQAQGAHPVGYHRLEEDRHGTALPQQSGDRRTRRFATLATDAIASSLYGDPTDKGMPAYEAVIKMYKAQANAPDPWHIVAFSELLTTVRFLNEARVGGKITPARVLAAAKAFKGPLALGPPKLVCGKYKDAPAICNDSIQAFTYKGKGAFTRASGWISP